jgi:hypothetical protein
LLLPCKDWEGRLKNILDFRAGMFIFIAKLLFEYSAYTAKNTTQNEFLIVHADWEPRATAPVSVVCITVLNIL